MLSNQSAGFEHIISGDIYKHIVEGRKWTKSKKKNKAQLDLFTLLEVESEYFLCNDHNIQSPFLANQRCCKHILTWCCDIREVIKQFVDWRSAIHVARSCSISTMFVLAILKHKLTKYLKLCREILRNMINRTVSKYHQLLQVCKTQQSCYQY